MRKALSFLLNVAVFAAAFAVTQLVLSWGTSPVSRFGIAVRVLVGLVTGHYFILLVYDLKGGGR